MHKDRIKDWRGNAFLGTIEIVCSVSGNSTYGTGFIIDFGGPWVVTNAHGVLYNDGTEMTVFPSIQGRFYDSDVMYDLTCRFYDSEEDIALLSFDNLDRLWKPLSLGDSSKLRYGDKVFTIGNSRGNGLAFSSGVVSIPLINVIIFDNIRPSVQTNIPINEGNSGGPVFDECGEVVGMMSFRMRDQHGEVVQGTSFAIPSNLIKEYIQKSL
ncbi:MAG: S1C family serine protease [Methanomassiliicoccaceae archaeon]|nr:S1C family serine protease [Methanomassiliicoccaceae archaeon]